MTTTFSPQLLNNFEALQNFLSGDEATKRIQTSAPDQPNFGFWKVTWIVVTYPVVWITTLALEILRNLLFITCLRSLSKKVDILSNYVHLNATHLFTKIWWGKSLLVPTQNIHSAGTSDVFIQAPVKRENILSKEIREKLHPNVDFVDFYKHEARTYSTGHHIGPGLCQGMVYWFNHLFLKTFDGTHFIDHARKVAREFEYGAPREAAILQALPGVERDLLKLEGIGVNFFTQEAFEKKPLEFWDKIEQLEDGAYLLGLATHGMAFLKYKGEKLLFDPNEGLFSIHSMKDLSAHIDQHVKGEKHYFVWLFPSMHNTSLNALLRKC